MEIKLIDRIQGLNTLRDEWEGFLRNHHNHTLFQTWLWHSMWWKYFSKDQKLHILTLRQGDSLKGIAPLCLQKSHTKVLQFIGGMDLTDYMDFIVAQGWEQDFFKALAEYFARQREIWSEMQLHFIPETSPALTYLKQSFEHQGLEVTLEKEEVCPYVELPSSWKSYLSGLDKKNRHELRRKINKIFREAQVQMRIINRADFTEALGSFVRLHKLSSPEKTDFMDHEHRDFFYEIAQSLSAEGIFELPLLMTDKNALASLYCFVYRKRAYIYNSGYDPAYSRWSPGIVVISLYIEELIKRGIKVVDFLRGSESYKYSFGTENHQLFMITVT
jgi:CelD/BcsL family acetyltransferase involved in cellulose biosynthesis